MSHFATTHPSTARAAERYRARNPNAPRLVSRHRPPDYVRYSQMTTVEQVKQCRTPQEALLVLAAAIDALAVPAAAPDPWSAPINWGEDDNPALPKWAKDNRARVENGDVVVQRVSAEREVARAEFCAATQLWEFDAALCSADFVEAYIKGGPRWLYYTNRDAVMRMPITTREGLVADVLLDSPTEADEIGRDILKFGFDEANRETANVDHQRASRDFGPLK